jgi:hypothetical protein
VEDSNISLPSKSSVSPESRVLSEQSEITLDSDSKPNSVQSKLLQSPQNSTFKTSDSSNNDHRSFGDIAEAEVELNKDDPQRPKSPILSETNVRKEKSFAEQDMFSEHFDVSFINT